MIFQVVISEKAQEELQEIYDYIADTGFPQTAEKVITELKEAIFSLSYMPERCRLFDVEPWKSKGVRIKVSGAYGIYYTVEHDDTVRIHHVFNCRMDIARHFLFKYKPLNSELRQKHWAKRFLVGRLGEKTCL